MTMRITMTQTRMGESGSLLTSGTTYTVSDAFGAAMVGSGYAIDVDDALTPISASNQTRDVWQRIPSVFRLRITGTGSMQMDSRDSLGNVTNGTFPLTSYTGETDKIEFPYAGDDAVAIRVTLTGTLTCEVI